MEIFESLKLGKIQIKSENITLKLKKIPMMCKKIIFTDVLRVKSIKSIGSD